MRQLKTLLQSSILTEDKLLDELADILEQAVDANSDLERLLKRIRPNDLTEDHKEILADLSAIFMDGSDIARTIKRLLR